MKCSVKGTLTQNKHWVGFSKPPKQGWIGERLSNHTKIRSAWRTTKGFTALDQRMACSSAALINKNFIRQIVVLYVLTCSWYTLCCSICRAWYQMIWCFIEWPLLSFAWLWALQFCLQDNYVNLPVLFLRDFFCFPAQHDQKLFSFLFYRDKTTQEIVLMSYADGRTVLHYAVNCRVWWICRGCFCTCWPSAFEPEAHLDGDINERWHPNMLKTIKLRKS